MFKQWPDRGRQQGSVLIQEFDVQDLADSLHAHSEYELTFIVSGSGEYVIGRSVGGFGRGSLLLCPPNLLHGWRSDGGAGGGSGVMGIVLRFRKESLPKGLMNLAEMASLRRLLSEVGDGLWFEVSDRDRLRLRLRSIHRAQGALRLARFYVALELIATYRRRQVVGGDIHKDDLAPRSVARFAAARRYLNEHFRQDIGRADLARHLGLNETAFSRFFHEASGTTFVDYLSNLRVQHAATALGNRRDLSIADIAEQSGFKNLSSFHRQFKKRLGITPKAYRSAANSEALEP